MNDAIAFDRIKFWQNPNESQHDQLVPTCRPEFYLDLVNVSRLVVSTLERHAQKDWSILEIGCGTGRNLAALKRAGFANVSGIEVSEYAIDLGRETFPEYAGIPVVNAAIEDAIEDVEPVNAIYTSGLLMHLPYELDWVLEKVAEKAKRLLMTNEGEHSLTINAWKRNYKDFYEALGWRQVEEETGDNYPPLPSTTIKRVFVRA